MIYLLDTNAISDWLSPAPMLMESRVKEALRAGHLLIICQPIYYEVRRGLIARNYLRRLRLLHDSIVPLLEYQVLEDSDWIQAGDFWVEADRKGKKLSDIDLLLAALAHRLDAIIVSADADFDALPVKREDWRAPLP